MGVALETEAWEDCCSRTNGYMLRLRKQQREPLFLSQPSLPQGSEVNALGRNHRVVIERRETG